MHIRGLIPNLPLCALQLRQVEELFHLLDEDGNRLSKREKSIAIAALREDGLSPAEIRTMAGFPDG